MAPALQAAGYATKPLADKLGLKPGLRGAVLAPPDGFLETIRADRLALEVVDSLEQLSATGYDYLHLFVRERERLEVALPVLRAALGQRGMLWVSWPKRAARVPTDVSETVVRELALAQALVDVKVCAIDPVWSGLKLVIPKALRRRD